jgi:cytochrome c-type biogenesis protein CcmF
VTAALGRALILVALGLSAAGAVVALSTARRGDARGHALARGVVYAVAALMLAANALMVQALVTHDFSVSYVARVGSRAIPTWVSVVSLWSSLEGSILFWGLILGGYMAAATWASRGRDPDYMAWAAGMMLACAVFFCFLIAGPANPFLTVSPAPPDGPGPNPLLQNHLLMIIHPPLLYLGYVGMTVPFALACAALLTGRLGHDFLRVLRRWLLVPWTFLTLGIVMGGWWAYEVLGWGGYWDWDPVENASFLPWLTATAALHSALVVERRGLLKAWTLTLILVSFLLTILGTFMTRSGIFNSVHSFTQSDIGPTFLVFLAVGLVFSVLLLASRGSLLTTDSNIESAKSRESAFLANNLFFVAFTFVVLVGTVFPLIVEAVRGVQMSVGSPYFNRMAVPLGVAILFLMGVGPALPWGAATPAEATRALVPPLAGGALAAAFGALLGARNPWALATIACGGYTLQVTFAEMLRPVRTQVGRGGAGRITSALRLLVTRGRRRFGGYVAHTGAILVIVAIAVSSTGRAATEGVLKRGESLHLDDYTVTFDGARMAQESHRQASVAELSVTRAGARVATLAPRLNFYFTQREPVGAPAVHSTLVEDVYLSVMSVDVDAQTVGLRAFVNPMVAWIWLGAGVIGLGALLALWPARGARPRGRPA